MGINYIERFGKREVRDLLKGGLLFPLPSFLHDYLYGNHNDSVNRLMCLIDLDAAPNDLESLINQISLMKECYEIAKSVKYSPCNFDLSGNNISWNEIASEIDALIHGVPIEDILA